LIDKNEANLGQRPLIFISLYQKFRSDEVCMRILELISLPFVIGAFHHVITRALTTHWCMAVV